MKSSLRQLLVISAAATAAALLTGIVATGAAQEPGARRGDPAIVSPEVAADHRVTVRLRAPEAKAVTVSGDFGSDVEMRKSADGIWSATIGPLDPEMYVYYFTLDGVRLTDPSNPEVKIGYVTSTTTSLLTVPDDGDRSTARWPTASTGRLSASRWRRSGRAFRPRAPGDVQSGRDHERWNGHRAGHGAAEVTGRQSCEG